MDASGRLQVREQQSRADNCDDREGISETAGKARLGKSHKADAVNEINERSFEKRRSNSGGESCAGTTEESKPQASVANRHSLVTVRGLSSARCALA
jgi:hypothetical protein